MLQGVAPALHAEMTKVMESAYGSDKSTWPCPCVPVTSLWFGCGPSVLHKDVHVSPPFITVPLAVGMAGGTVLAFPEIMHGFYCQPGDMCAFDGSSLLHGLTVPTLCDESIRLVLSMWIDSRVIEHFKKFAPPSPTSSAI